MNSLADSLDVPPAISDLLGRVLTFLVTFPLVISFVLAATGLQTVNAQIFPDVSGEMAFSTSIEDFAEAGIVGGYSDGEFKPKEPLTRMALAKILARLHYPEDYIAGCVGSEFADIDIEENREHFKILCILKRHGIFEGYSDNTFRPSELIGLEALAKVTTRVYELEIPEGGDSLMAVAEAGYIPDTFDCIEEKDILERDIAVEILHRAENEISDENHKGFNDIISCKNKVVHPMSDASCFGYYRSRGYTVGHKGIDWPANSSCRIGSIAEGIVKKAGVSGSMGNYVVVEHSMEGGYQSLYMHGSSINVEVGDFVKAGDILMTIGSTGRSTTNHLHLSVSTGNKDVVRFGNRVNPDPIFGFNN